MESFSRLTISEWKKVREIIAEQTNDSMTRLQKVKAIHNWMVKYLQYDMALVQHNASNTLNTGWAVCSGYAALFLDFMDEMEIPCKEILGRAGGTGGWESHAWNLVEMDDGYWYYVDVTWDDPIIGRSSNFPSGLNLTYKYFLAGSATLERDHIPDSRLPGISVYDYDW